jgi:hypothetical protein
LIVAERPLDAGRCSPISRHLIESGAVKVAGKDLIGRASSGQPEIAVGCVRVVPVKRQVAIGVQVHPPCTPNADFRATVHGKPGDKVSAGLAVAAGCLGHTRRSRITLAVQGIARDIRQAVVNGEREPIVGQWLLEVDGHVAGGQLAGGHG